jgi:hypothetical protein
MVAQNKPNVGIKAEEKSLVFLKKNLTKSFSAFTLSVVVVAS